MKNYIVGGLMLLSVSSTFCMQEQQFANEQSKELIPVVLPNELRLLITKFLFTTAYSSEAIKALQAWTCTNSIQYKFLKQDGMTTNLVRYLHKLSYYDKFNMPLLAKTNMNILLHQEEFKTFTNSLVEGVCLVKLFRECSENKQWEDALKKLNGLAKTPLASYIANYYWKDSYYGFPARKTLLVYALELDAPGEIIKILIECGSSLTPLHPFTPPPCLVICDKLLRCKEEDKKALLEGTMDMLIKKGVSLNDSFFALDKNNPPKPPVESPLVTPLIIAITEDDLARVQYLLKKGSRICKNSISHSVMRFSCSQAPLDIVKVLIAKCSNNNLQYLLHILIKIAIDLPNQMAKDNCTTHLLPLFLNNNTTIDINALYGGRTLLDIVQNKEGNETIASMLIARGAVTTNSSNVIDTIAEKTITILKHLAQENRREDYFAAIRGFLEELKAPLLDGKLSKKTELILQAFSYAWKALPSQESKEFFKLLALHGGFNFFNDRFNLTTDSVFQLIVIMVASQPKQKDVELLRRAYDIISWLAKEGVKDEEMKAVRIAETLGMPELAHHIVQELKNAANKGQ